MLGNKQIGAAGHAAAGFEGRIHVCGTRKRHPYTGSHQDIFEII